MFFKLLPWIWMRVLTPGKTHIGETEMIRGYECGNRDCDLTVNALMLMSLFVTAPDGKPARMSVYAVFFARPTPKEHLIGLIFSATARMGMLSGVKPLHTEQDITLFPFPSMRTLKSCNSPFELFETTTDFE
jgi:hypothetical protein